MDRSLETFVASELSVFQTIVAVAFGAANTAYRFVLFHLFPEFFSGERYAYSATELLDGMISPPFRELSGFKHPYFVRAPFAFYSFLHILPSINF